MQIVTCNVLLATLLLLMATLQHATLQQATNQHATLQQATNQPREECHLKVDGCPHFDASDPPTETNRIRGLRGEAGPPGDAGPGGPRGTDCDCDVTTEMRRRVAKLEEENGMIWEEIRALVASKNDIGL